MSFYTIIQSLVNEKLFGSEELNSEAAFCEIVTEYLEESSLIPEFQHSFFFKEEESNKNLKINGFCISEGEDVVLSMFISEYNITDIEGNVNLKDAELLFKQLIRVYNYVIRPDNNMVPKANLLSFLSSEYRGGLKDKIVQINFYLLTNNNAVNRKEIKAESILSKTDLQSDISYNFRIIDIKELERLHKNNQKLDIEVSEYFDKPIHILKPNLGNSSYGTAIAILPGKFLYNIYNEYGGRLLESNVRSFLSSRIKVNLGIKGTLLKNPDMFLAYNNGLCVTVSEIEMNEDNSVKTFKDFQIVNGGQTTSSIFFVTQEAKKNRIVCKLDNVNVMAKITEIRRNIDSLKIQSTIAQNSNLQNAVRQSDLSSNDEFLINLHSSSKKYRNPKSNSYYYFERTRGQYQMEKNLSKNERQFLNLFPKSNKIEKSDLSILFFCAWGSRSQPYIAVESAEKRYNRMKAEFDSENKKMGEEYFTNLAGSYIVYNYVKSKYGAGNNAIGRIRKNVVAYSISLIQHQLKKSNQEIDYTAVWKKGKLDIAEAVIKMYLIYLNDLLLKTLDDGRLDEACKKEDSWKKILSNVDEDKLNSFINCFPIRPFNKNAFKWVKSSFDTNSKFEVMVDEINANVSTFEQYLKLHDRVSDEIETHQEDGMSLYSRRHLSLLNNHFRPNLELALISPLTYKLYLADCCNKNGDIIKSKFEDFKTHILDLYRVFNAILRDEMLNL